MLRHLILLNDISFSDERKSSSHPSRDDSSGHFLAVCTVNRDSSTFVSAEDGSYLLHNLSFALLSFLLLLVLAWSTVKGLVHAMEHRHCINWLEHFVHSRILSMHMPSFLRTVLFVLSFSSNVHTYSIITHLKFKLFSLFTSLTRINVT